MKTTTSTARTVDPRPCWIFIVILCGFLAFEQGTQAVIPPPDGGYAGGNTAEGQNALLHLTTGAGNTAVGWFSLNTVTTGSFNTGIGAGALVLNRGDENTALGTAALFLNTANGNTAVGSKALLNNTTGGTLESVNGVDLGPNLAIGMEALESNTVSSANTAVGYQALHSFITGIAGFPQLGLNTAVGFQALANTNGANGGSRNSGFGYQALFNNTDGFENVAIGDQALFGNETGFRNTAIGGGAGSNVTTASNVICIGWGQGGDNIDNSCFIGNIAGVPVANGAPVMVSPTGQLGTVSSSRRFKKKITPMDSASEGILSLRPVTFRYKTDKTDTPQFGLIAEEVAEINPDLIMRDENGAIYSVRYDAVNAMLLNEFLKEHKKIERQGREIYEQRATITKLQTTVAERQKGFQTTLAEQEKQIKSLVKDLQRVSAQLETSRSVSQRVALSAP